MNSSRSSSHSPSSPGRSRNREESAHRDANAPGESVPRAQNVRHVRKGISVPRGTSAPKQLRAPKVRRQQKGRLRTAAHVAAGSVGVAAEAVAAEARTLQRPSDRGAAARRGSLLSGGTEYGRLH